LITKVIQLLEFNQNLQQHCSLFLSEKMDASIVYFFSQYRRSYLGEPNAEAVYIKPNEAFGIEGQTDMLNLIMRKM
jgi:exportin-7